MEEGNEKKGRKEMEERNDKKEMEEGNDKKEMEEEKDGQRQKAIDRVTIGGSMVNVVLLVFKFVAGVLGGSAAMIADAVHSLSDFVTDLVVLVFIRLSGKPQDKGHDYGHGKYETLATALIGGMLLAVGVMICVGGVSKIWDAFHGVVLPQPGWIALVAALLSVVSKEWCYRFTVRVGRQYQSSVVVANAWHHRSDALSSVGTSVGIGGAILLGHQWTILDPLTAVAVSGFIIWEAVRLVRESVGDLLEASLPDEVEQQIARLVCEEPGVSGLHNLRTRRIGDHYAIEMHVRMPGAMTLYEAHRHASAIEQNIKHAFGPATHVIVHLEPLKENGAYVEP